MRRHSTRSTFSMLFVALLAFAVGCSSMLRVHPPGDRIGSCEGKMRLQSGKRVSFRFDLYNYRDDTRLYFSIPGHYHFRPVEDIDMDNGRIGIELSSPHRIVEGELIGSNLKFSGKFNGFSGVLNLELDD